MFKNSWNQNQPQLCHTKLHHSSATQMTTSRVYITNPSISWWILGHWSVLRDSLPSLCRINQAAIRCIIGGSMQLQIQRCKILLRPLRNVTTCTGSLSHSSLLQCPYIRIYNKSVSVTAASTFVSFATTAPAWSALSTSIMHQIQVPGNVIKH